jgi:anti-sigma factor ChrR (cupin superfamily)
MMESHPPKEQLVAYCRGSANAIGVWVTECHLLLCRRCRDSVADIDQTVTEPQRNGSRRPGLNIPRDKSVVRW